MSTAALVLGVGALLVGTGLVLAVAGFAGVGREPTPPRSTDPRNLPVTWLLAGAAGLVVLLLTGWPAAAAGAAGAVIIVPSVLSGSGAEARVGRLEALAAWTRRLADLLGSGAVGSLEAALRRSLGTCPDAIKPEVSAMVSRLNPQGVETALRSFADDIDDPAGDLVAAALILRSRHGGRGLAQVLTGLATDLDDRVRMARDVEADRAKPRSNVRIMVLFTLALTAGLVLFARSFLEPYSSLFGQLALAGIVALFAASLLWLRKLSKPVIGVRFLTSDPRPAVRQ